MHQHTWIEQEDYQEAADQTGSHGGDPIASEVETSASRAELNEYTNTYVCFLRERATFAFDLRSVGVVFDLLAHVQLPWVFVHARINHGRSFSSFPVIHSTWRS